MNISFSRPGRAGSLDWVFSAIRRSFFIFLLGPAFLALATTMEGTIVKDGVTLDVKMYHGGGGPTGQKVVGDFMIQHCDEFKGAKRVAISVFNVAFPDENSLTASLHSKPRSFTSNGYYMSVTTTTSFNKTSTLHTALSGVDQATRQRIADAAYASFVEELQHAGYEVVPTEQLAKLAPEYLTWKAQPNFTKGRFGTYVAPTGRSVYFLQGDASKRDVSGKKAQLFLPFRAFDRPQAMTRSPYLAYDAKLGIIAVTLVIDYGVYSTTGETRKVHDEVKVEFEKSVAAQSGTFADTATVVQFWGPKSGGFAGIAVLAVPVRTDQPFGELTGGDGNVVVNADAAKFEQAALEVVHHANTKLVGAMVGER
jgi:hypothetical protein